MKITSKEYLTTDTLRTLKEKARHKWRVIRAREAEGGARRRTLAIIDQNRSIYYLRYRIHYKNIAEEYEQLKQLKTQLEKDFPIIECTTATSKTIYKNYFKIIYKGAKNV